MALEIKAIPTLTGEDAKRFVEEADKACQDNKKTDFSQQVKTARAILRKANMLQAWDFCLTNAVCPHWTTV